MVKFDLYLKENFDFTENEVQLTIEKFRKVKLQKGDYFLKEGEFCKSVAFVEEGVMLYYENIDGDWVSQLESLTNNIPSKLNIKTIEDSSVWIISSNDLEQLKTKVPKLKILQAGITESLYIKAVSRISDFAHLTAKERYNKEITANPKLEKYVPQYYLASYLGIKPQSLSRIRSEY